MAIVIRYKCRRCGALWEGGGAAGPSAWIRCASCKALVDFEWQSFFESDAYKQMLSHGAALAAEWGKYGQLGAEAMALHAKGDHKGAEQRFRAQAEMQLRLNPFMYPPECQQPGAYREAVLKSLAWWLVQNATDPSVMALQAQINANQQKMDWRDPLPTIQKTIEIMRGQFKRLEQGDAPPDPDGMTPEERFRISAGMILGAFISFLTPAARLALLKQLHGEQSVFVKGDADEDEVGMYMDWTCNACGLTSIQARMVAELCCVGCYFRRPFKASDLHLPAVSATCTGCGAKVDVPAGALQATCKFCHAVSTRLGRTGQAEREFSQAMMAQYGAQQLPEGGIQIMPVTAQNHAELVLSGLARVANMYSTFINAERYAHVVRPSLAAIKVDEVRGMREVRTRLAAEGGQPQAFELVDACIKFMAANPRKTA